MVSTNVGNDRRSFCGGSDGGVPPVAVVVVAFSHNTGS